MEEINKEEVNRYLSKSLRYSSIVIDFFCWEGFGILWNFSIEQDWWWEFSCKLYYLEESWDLLEKADYDGVINEKYINPEVFPIKVYNYLRGGEK